MYAKLGWNFLFPCQWDSMKKIKNSGCNQLIWVMIIDTLTLAIASV